MIPYTVYSKISLSLPTTAPRHGGGGACNILPVCISTLKHDKKTESLQYIHMCVYIYVYIYIYIYMTNDSKPGRHAPRHGGGGHPRLRARVGRQGGSKCPNPQYVCINKYIYIYIYITYIYIYTHTNINMVLKVLKGGISTCPGTQVS